VAKTFCRSARVVSVPLPMMRARLAPALAHSRAKA
jgi:hypothetical protein